MATSAKHGYCVEPSTSTVFETIGQEASSSGALVSQFHFVKLKADSIITHRFPVIEDSKDAMVTRRDLLQTLGLIINFQEQRTVSQDLYRETRQGDLSSDGVC